MFEANINSVNYLDIQWEVRQVENANFTFFKLQNSIQTTSNLIKKEAKGVLQEI
jgi:hypothetical protein